MDVNSATLKRNAVLIYTVILTLGALLSGFVYFASQKVEQSTLTLIEREIPILDQLRQLDSYFTEQELYLNEYYANQNRALYNISFLDKAEQTNELLTKIQKHNLAQEKVEQLKQAQNAILELAILFDQNMEFGDNDTLEKWDLAREHLLRFTELRQQTKPIVKQIADETNERVHRQYALTRQNLDQTNQTVLIYSLMILVIAIVIGRYIKSYLLVSAKNKRLALFPQRNPNPILSLDQQNKIAFANPATYKLIDELGQNLEEFSQTILTHLPRYQQEIKNKEQMHTRFEIAMNGRTLDCELHWLKDLATWDLHLVDISKRKLAEERLNYQAFHEAETGLYNKNKFVQVLKQLTTEPNHVAVGSLEVRHYSQMVSKLGLDQTAATIVELAKLLDELFAEHLADIDYTFFQTSDKQFSLVINTDFCSLQIESLVDRVEAAVEYKAFLSGIHIELDFGFCCYPEQAQTVESLIKAVNIALDHAIAVDHSSLVIYSNELGEAISNEIELTERLRIATENKELQLYFQPQLDIQQNRIVGLETLIRWQTENGFISPAEFIPLAEKSGLIIPLGSWIVESACHVAQQLVMQGYRDLVVAINISPQQFQHPNFYQMIVDALEKSRVPPQNIELEITEGVIMYNESETIDQLYKLRKLGLKLSIDDFGTGYSSLSYLKQFPIDKLKIDQSFIRTIEASDADRAIVSAIVDLGKNLDLTLIAEGVEEQSQQDILHHMGCQEIQGYLFSRPQPIDNLVDLLSSHFSKERSA